MPNGESSGSGSAAVQVRFTPANVFTGRCLRLRSSAGELAAVAAVY